MRRIIFPYGAIAGAVTIGTMIAFTLPSEDGVGGSVWLGFLVMILALSLIYLGIRPYREHELGGVLRFRTGGVLWAGLLIAAAPGYVVGVGGSARGTRGGVRPGAGGQWRRRLSFPQRRH